ncbi:PAS domain S-box protein [Robertmurraya mangrovi]
MDTNEENINNYQFAQDDPSNLMNTIFSNITEGIIIFDSKGKIVDVNPSICITLNRTKEDLIGQTLESLVPKEKQFKIEKQWEILSYKKHVKGHLPIINGESIIDFDFTTSTLVDHQLYVSILRDVTEKLLLEKKVKKNAELYEGLFLEALDAIVFWDNETRVVNANEAACKLFECSLDELINKKLNDFVYKKNAPYYSFIKTLKDTGSVRDETLFLMPNGQKKYVEFTSKLYAVDGYHMSIFRNVSERYQMEQDLRESESRFRSIFEGALEGFVLWNDHFEIVDINPAGEKMINVPKAHIVGRSLKNILSDCEYPQTELHEQIRLLETDGKSSGTINVTLNSGENKHFEFSTKYNVISNLSLTVFKDITEKLELEERLHKSDTLNVIGELAAGIAHEIRNPMTALKGFIQLLEDSVTDKNAMYFDVITTELNRIDSIINEFLILAKPQAIKFVEQDIRVILTETVNLLNAQAMLHNIVFKLDYSDDIPPLFCEPNQLKKVFINIIKNAIEVMDKGGTITVTATTTSDSRIHISIRDEGFGIPEEKIKKLGQPFYTTKDRGTGLGLMVTYRIIEEHKGLIEVESEVGVGTVFHIYLPESN